MRKGFGGIAVETMCMTDRLDGRHGKHCERRIVQPGGRGPLCSSSARVLSEGQMERNLRLSPSGDVGLSFDETDGCRSTLHRPQ